MKRYFLIFLMAFTLVLTACATPNISTTTPTIAPPETNGSWRSLASKEQINTYNELEPKGFNLPIVWTGEHGKGQMFIMYKGVTYDKEQGEFAFSAASVFPNGKYNIFIYIVYDKPLPDTKLCDVYLAGAGDARFLGKMTVDRDLNSPIWTFYEKALNDAPKGFRLGKPQNELEV